MFWRFLPDEGCVLGVVMSRVEDPIVDVDEGRMGRMATAAHLASSAHLIKWEIGFESLGMREVVDDQTLRILLASGETAADAQVAYDHGVCQICLRINK